MTTADAAPSPTPPPSPEAAVGITAYASPDLPGFTAILKHRFTDFCVAELHAPPDGGANKKQIDIASAAPVGLPPRHDARAEAAAVDAAARAARAAEDAALVNAAVKGETSAPTASCDDDPLAAAVATLAALTTPAAAEAVHALLAAAVQDAAASPPPVDLPPMADKAARTGVHAWARAAAAGVPGLAGRLETVTVAGGGGGGDSAIRVVVWPAGHAGGRGGGGGGRGRGRGKKRGRSEDSGRPGAGAGQTRDPRNARDGGWPGGRACPYCHFTLVKANMETGAALGALARAAGARPDAFAVAGTKDKRGVTAQRVSAYRLSASALAAGAARASAGPGSGRLRVGHFTYAAHPLHLGDAAGNEFRLALRGLDPHDARDAAAAVSALGSSAGFVNYFGLQRFGTGGAPTHAVGAALATGAWERAARLILAPRGGDGGGGGGNGGADAAAARSAWLAGAATAAATLHALPRSATAERALLAGLARAPSDFAGALAGLPRGLKSLYTHALQAALWNAAASARAGAEGGGGGAAGPALAGDLVVVGDGGGGEEEEEAEEEGEGAGGPALPTTTPSTTDDAGPRPLPAVHTVTAAEAAAGTYTAADVVLPLPGWGTWPPPPGPAADAARGAARTLGLDLDALFPGPDPAEPSPPHGTAGRAWLPGARGGYRRLFHVPAGGLASAWVAHAGPDDDLLVPDGGGEEDSASIGPLAPAARPWAPGTPLPPGTSHAALVLRFRLPPSGYATMVVRELTKQTTAAPPPPPPP
jgi:tRNA pseudouridine13 synthase